MGYCKICDKRWKSMSECHCSGCHQHFKSDSAFDKHRFGLDEKRRCLTSEEMISRKMVYIPEKGYWIGKAMTTGREYGKK